MDAGQANLRVVNQELETTLTLAAPRSSLGAHSTYCPNLHNLGASSGRFPQARNASCSSLAT